MWKRIVLILCFALLMALAGCGAKDKKADPATKTLQIRIDPDTVEQIDLYWNYRAYSLRREDNGALIDNTVELLNGDYAVNARWSNTGTGSGDHISFFDAEGELLKTYYIFRSEDGPFSIWEEGTEHFNYLRETSPENLQEIVKMIADERYWGKMP